MRTILLISALLFYTACVDFVDDEADPGPDAGADAGEIEEDGTEVLDPSEHEAYPTGDGECTAPPGACVTCPGIGHVCSPL